MREYSIVWDDDAMFELSLIWSFLSRKSFASAKRITNGIEKATYRLKISPFIGQEDDTLKVLNLGHRYLIYRNYKIVYRIIDEFVLIVTVFDTRQDPDKLLDIKDT